jgi:hypothetical protein
LCDVQVIGIGAEKYQNKEFGPRKYDWITCPARKPIMRFKYLK